MGSSFPVFAPGRALCVLLQLVVAALCACETGAMDESEFDRLSIVRIDRDGRPTLSVTRQDDAGR